MVSLVLYEPAEGSSNIVLDMQATNDNVGAIYDSADLNLTSRLASDLWALTTNQSTYATMQDMIADWDMNIRTAPTGEVSNGWNFIANSDGSFSITNDSITGGEIDTDYDGWYSTSTDSSQDMQFYTLNIPKSQLEFDGIAGYDPNSDATIVLSGEENTIPDAFVGSTGGNAYQAEGQYFQVAVPEFSSSALVMGGLAALFAAFRRRLSRSRLPFVG